MRRFMFVGLIAAALLAVPVAAFAGVGPPGEGAFYVDGELYRTVATPAHFTPSAPDHSRDIIYAFAEQTNVAEDAPGDPGYNGGRWLVMAISGNYAVALAYADDPANGGNDSGNFDSAEEVEAALDAGLLTAELVDRFECPVIPVPGGGH